MGQVSPVEGRRGDYLIRVIREKVLDGSFPPALTSLSRELACVLAPYQWSSLSLSRVNSHARLTRSQLKRKDRSPQTGKTPVLSKNSYSTCPAHRPCQIWALSNPIGPSERPQNNMHSYPLPINERRE